MHPRHTLREVCLELCKGGGVVKKVFLQESEGPDKVMEWEAEAGLKRGKITTTSALWLPSATATLF